MIKKIALVAALLVSSEAVFSEGVANKFYVEQVRADRSGKGYIKFESVLEGTPASCGSSFVRHLAFDLNTEAGQGIMSLGLAAKMPGKPIC